MKFKEAVRALDCCARTVMALLHVYNAITEERSKSLNRIYEFADKVLSDFYSDSSLLSEDLEVLWDKEVNLPCWHTYEESPLELAIRAMRQILHSIYYESSEWITLERNEE